jgi:hypothetical protein
MPANRRQHDHQFGECAFERALSHEKRRNINHQVDGLDLSQNQFSS